MKLGLLKSRGSWTLSWHFAALLLTIAGVATVKSELVPAERLANWTPGTTVGVIGGIPQRTTIFRTIPAGSSASTIQSALDACPSEQTVLLEPGSYTISSSLNLRDRVTLRGSGIDQTILNLTGSAAIFANGAYDQYNSANKTQAESIGSAGTSVISGATRGSTDLTLASTSAFSVGGFIEMSPLNPPSQYNDPVVVQVNGHQYRLRHQARVTAKTSTRLTFMPPLTWDYTNNCKVVQSAIPRVRCGIEDLHVNGTSSSAYYLVQMAGSGYDNWMKNVRVSGASSYAVYIWHQANFEMRGCYIGRSRSTPSSNQSGLLYEAVSGGLIENNIFDTGFPLIEINYGADGNVFGYNFFTNAIWNDGGLMPNHGPHNHHNLFEGNIIPNITGDGYFGSDSHHTYLRNWIYNRAGGRAVDSSVAVVRLMRFNRDNSLIGNVITAGSSTWAWLGYGNYGTSSSGTAPPWAQWGTGPGSGGFQERDTGVSATLISKGNRWTFDNSTNSLGGDTLVNSFYLTAKPSWFGNLAWPPIDPAKPGFPQFSSIPAGYRYIYGQDPPSGGTGNQAPTAVATASVTSGDAPLTVAFSSAGSSDPEGASLTYSWPFGDGGTSTQANPTHVYQSAGSYTARLTVSDGTLTGTSSALNITVTAVGVNQPPVAAATATPTSGLAPLAVAFSSSGSADPEGDPLSYLWTFGDGTTSTAANPSHTYAAAGTYVAHLSVSDGNSSADSASITLSAFNAGSGLVAAYGFEEGTGVTTEDSSQQGNTGTLNGGTWTTLGKYGKALSFNGTSDLVIVNSSSSLNLSSGMTLEAWVYPTATQSGWSSILHKEADAYYLHASSPAGAMIPAGGAVYDGTESYLAGTTPLPLNTWTHLAVTYDGAMVRLFVNGSQVSSTAHTGTIQVTSNPLRIGGNTYGQYFQGVIDEVRIYSRAITAAEVASDMVNPVLQRPLPPLALRVVGP